MSSQYYPNVSLCTLPGRSYLKDLHNTEASAQLHHKHLVSMRSQLNVAPWAVPSPTDRLRGLRVSSLLNPSVSLSSTLRAAASL